MEYFIDRFGKRSGKKLRTIDKKSLKAFQSYAWPGNVRELQNVIERAVILSEGGTLAIDENGSNVILLDLTLPGLSSRKVFEEALRVQPNLKVVLTSAYSKETVDASFTGLRITHFIRKPFHLSELEGVLQDALS